MKLSRDCVLVIDLTAHVHATSTECKSQLSSPQKILQSKFIRLTLNQDRFTLFSYIFTPSDPFRIRSGFFQDFQESRPRIWSRSRGIPYNSSRIVRVTQRLSRIPSRVSVSIIVKYCPDCPVSSKGFHQDLPNSAHFKEMAPNSNWPISTHHHPI